MHYEERLFGFVVAAIGIVQRVDAGTAAAVLDLAEAMEAEFSARIKARRAGALVAPRPADAEAAPAELPACDWTAGGVTCGRPSVARRAQRGFGGPVRSFCAAHEAEGDSLGYWLPKAAP